MICNPMEFEAGTHLVLGKVQLGLGGLAGAVAGGKGARAPAAAAAHLVQPIHLRAEAVAGRHEHHAVVHHVRQRCEATTDIPVCPFLFNLRIAVNCTRYKGTWVCLHSTCSESREHRDAYADPK